MESEIPYVEKVYNNFWVISNHLSTLKPQGIDEAKNKILYEKGDFENNSRNFMIIMAASYYEKEIMIILKNYISEIEDEFAKNLSLKLINQSYFKLFDFKIKPTKAALYFAEDEDEDGRQNEKTAIIGNIYYFLNKFGAEFRDYCKEKIKKDRNLTQAIECFLIINYWRNKIVHGRYDDDSIARLPPAKRIHEQFIESKKFIDWFSKILKDYRNS